MGNRTIEIERTGEAGERAWRAVIRLPSHLPIDGYGIKGSSTTEGPWVEGFGYTPEGATQAAYIIIGKAVVVSTSPSVVSAVSERS